MKLMVCGSRTVTNTAWVFGQIDKVISENNFTDISIIEGEARGVDSISALWARRHGCEVLKYPADWNTLGKKAGFIRNEQMVKDCDFCLALWDGESHGTKNSIDHCKRYRKPYKVVIYGD